MPRNEQIYIRCQILSGLSLENRTQKFTPIFVDHSEAITRPEHYFVLSDEKLSETPGVLFKTSGFKKKITRPE